MTTVREQGYYREFDRFRITTHSDNPWTQEALGNVMALARDFDAARLAIKGTFTSVYRSEAINKAVGGAATSRHMRGLAADIKPDKDAFSPKAAAYRLWDAAINERIGIVQQVIWEPTWVHVGWYAPGEQDKGMQFLAKTPKGYVTLDTRASLTAT